MKMFNFPLEKVLNYKNQILENLQNELSVIQLQLNEVEKILSDLNNKYKLTSDGLLLAYKSDITAKDIHSYKIYLNEIDKQIRLYEQKREAIRAQFLKKQNEIVNAKIEVSTFEKLKEKQFSQYTMIEKKEQELFIEEFVNNAGRKSS